MVDLNLKERATLAKLEHKSAYVQREADNFTLFFDGRVLCQLDSVVCKSLIEKKVFVEIGNRHTTISSIDGDDFLGVESKETTYIDERWIYVADPRFFAPNFVIGEEDDLPF